MSRRTSLPGAAELFRRTGDGRDDEPADVPPAPRAPAQLAQVPRLPDAAGEPRIGAPVRRTGRRTSSPDAARRPTGREKHDEKITVYVSAEELLDLERARLTLRGDHGLAVDRGRIVREALSMVLADLEAHGEDSTLVRRLHGT